MFSEKDLNLILALTVAMKTSVLQNESKFIAKYGVQEKNQYVHDLIELEEHTREILEKPTVIA